MSTLSTSTYLSQEAEFDAQYAADDVPAGARPRLSVWSAFTLGMRLKTGGDGSASATVASLLKLAHQPAKLSRALTPLDFVRWREFDFALRAIKRHMRSPRYVLDISSPKLLPLTVASELRGCKVLSTDILEREVNWVRMAGDRLGLGNLTTRTLDARETPFRSNLFDLITSVSVFEHIAPERGGEIPAIREVARVLAPGGVAILTVPFSRQYFADYQCGTVYERSSMDQEPIFFQRFYDLDMLQQNIIAASGLDLLSLRFIDERHFSKDPHRRVAHFVNGSQRQTFWFGPMYPLLSHLFLSQAKGLEGCSKPYLACIVLRKGRAN
jgi:SAM-dependent methyltransferase